MIVVELSNVQSTSAGRREGLLEKKKVFVILQSAQRLFFSLHELKHVQQRNIQEEKLNARKECSEVCKGLQEG